jgi:uncharacterized membrane protein YdbT with pleckstrin-like domain
MIVKSWWEQHEQGYKILQLCIQKRHSLQTNKIKLQKSVKRNAEFDVRQKPQEDKKVIRTSNIW